MIAITMLVRDRPRLTEQSLRSIRQHTAWASVSITVLDDASKDETRDLLRTLSKELEFGLVRNEQSAGTGAARNQVIRASEELWGRGEYLYLSDNDVCMQPFWLDALLEAYQYARGQNYVALGAYNHPYNQPSKPLPYFSAPLGRTVEVCECDALALQSWLWTWEDWDQYGPFDITPVDRVRMSEDFAVSQKIRQAGGRVGVVCPSLILSTGVIDSFGQPIPGAELIERVAGVTYA